uniref:Poly [ADP-ribose] polymerase n=1 Tax=Ananas comosus var. bracteatus TaxID=296719 RepID=A0A6V7Q1C4_ANACO|nr:unnamed protein product [Ananas comosus var. bracteatus]
MKVHETRSHAHASAEEEGKMGTRRQKAESRGQDESSKKKPKVTDGENGGTNAKSAAAIALEFDEFCKATREHLSIEEMRRILEANAQDPSGSDDAVVPRCQDMMFYGPLESCAMCGGQLEYTGKNYRCQGRYSEWTTCPYTTINPPRKSDRIKVPEDIDNETAHEWVANQESRAYPQRDLPLVDKPFSGMMISLSGRLSRTHQAWREEIEKHGGKVSNSVIGVTCLVVSPAERERGGSTKVADAMERNIPVVSEAWLIDSIQKQEAQPFDAYNVVSDLAPEGRGIPQDKQDPSEEALESLTAENKLYGKRAVYKDSMLDKDGGQIFEKDGIIYNCAFSLCDQANGVNEYCVMQLIMVPENHLHLYYKKGRVGNDPRAEERVEDFEDRVGDAIKEFVRLFEELTGNEFEPWEREKKFEKKPIKFYPMDMDDGVDVRYGGLAPRQYALMEMGYDAPDLPVGMLTDLHLKRCEEVLLKFRDDLKSAPENSSERNIKRLDDSNRWFTLMHSTQPFTIKNYQELADHVAAGLETTRDINVASRLIGDMTGSTIDDPLSDRYEKLSCMITPVDKDSDDYKMIVNYLEKTYEPVAVADVSYGASVENIYAIESSACPYDEIKKLPNKVLLWCGTRSSKLLRHLHKGFQPAICAIPVPGYMFGKAIVCSDAAAEAARYGFTAIDRPEGFLVLAVVSLGEQVTEISGIPEDTKSLEEKKIGVKALGKKKPDESEHFTWKDDVKVPCGRLVPSENKDSPLEYNEYAVYDPKQVNATSLCVIDDRPF